MNFPQVLGPLVGQDGMNPCKPPSCPSTFCFFLVFNSVLLAQKFVIQCSSPYCVAFFFRFCKKTKVHRLIFNTYHTNGFNIPDLQPNYEHQYGMQHLKFNVITLIQLYINTTRTLKSSKPSLNLLFVDRDIIQRKRSRYFLEKEIVYVEHKCSESVSGRFIFVKKTA